MLTRPKMTWTKSSTELVDLFNVLAPKGPGIEQKKMFGWPCCFFSGNLFTGLFKESMLFRLSDADRAAFLKLDGAVEFEPMPGRKSKTSVAFANPLAQDRKDLAKWMVRSLENAKALPPKVKKAPKKAATKRAR